MMFKKLQSRLSVGKDWYHTYRKEIKLASNITVKNHLLYQELEQECAKRNGILTYAEYLQIEQFGKHGYYAGSRTHGKTDVEDRWGEALAQYCQKCGHDTIIEFGCGTGELGIATAKAYRKLTNKRLRWLGVEVDARIHPKIIANFKASNVQDSIEKLVSSVEELPLLSNVLLIFPYSLDNLPPHVFLNTKLVTAYPDVLLGLTATNGTLSEIIIPPEILQKKGITLHNGLFKQHTYTCNLTTWKLRRGQRAYIPTDSFITLYQYIKKFTDNSQVILIDEFRKEPMFFDLTNFGLPKSLHEHNLNCNERARYYQESGEHNLYYPLYRGSVMQFLNKVGFQSVMCEIEHKKAAQLRGEKWFLVGNNYTTYALFAKNLVAKKINLLPIPFCAKKIV